jgi:hypothetical protein
MYNILSIVDLRLRYKMLNEAKVLIKAVILGCKQTINTE